MLLKATADVKASARGSMQGALKEYQAALEAPTNQAPPRLQKNSYVGHPDIQFRYCNIRQLKYGNFKFVLFRILTMS